MAVNKRWQRATRGTVAAVRKDEHPTCDACDELLPLVGCHYTPRFDYVACSIGCRASLDLIPLENEPCVYVETTPGAMNDEPKESEPMNDDDNARHRERLNAELDAAIDAEDDTRAALVRMELKYADTVRGPLERWYRLRGDSFDVWTPKTPPHAYLWDREFAPWNVVDAFDAPIPPDARAAGCSSQGEPARSAHAIIAHPNGELERTYLATHGYQRSTPDTRTDTQRDVAGYIDERRQTGGFHGDD